MFIDKQSNENKKKSFFSSYFHFILQIH